MLCVYVIYSKQENQYYIGQTSDLGKRICEHNTAFYSGTFTSKSKDWELFYKIDCISNKQALKIERHLKKMKSRKFIEDLKRYPEISNKLISRFS